KNAIKYTSAGSIEIGYAKKGKFLEFFVKDSGMGISKDRQEAIFERFIQADISNKRAYDGAGLGLSIAKGYVEMLGGKIRVESQERQGSTFYFTIPCNGDHEEIRGVKNIVSAGLAESQIKILKILIAEDDETSEMLMRMELELFGKEILSVGTGTEAVETCRNNPDIDLIMMDIRMPEMNGYEATRQIRQFNNEVIIIAQTAFGLSGDREKALEAGCSDYLSKPIVLDELLGLLKKYFK
ncbi:MAG: response regulator, partial [Bacteroidales bacterium]